MGEHEWALDLMNNINFEICLIYNCQIILSFTWTCQGDMGTVSFNSMGMYGVRSLSHVLKHNLHFFSYFTMDHGSWGEQYHSWAYSECLQTFTPNNESTINIQQILSVLTHNSQMFHICRSVLGFGEGFISVLSVQHLLIFWTNEFPFFLEECVAWTEYIKNRYDSELAFMF